MANGKRSFTAALLLTALAGCVEEKPETAAAPPSVPPAELGRDFVASATGMLKGQITWEGPIPNVPAFQVYPDRGSHPEMPKWGTRPNPHAPRVNERNRGVGQAVVFLRHVDLAKARPWDHDPVQLEMKDWQIEVRQGSARSSVGFVRRGAAIQAVSRQKALHILRTDGAAFLSLPLPDPDAVTTRTLDRSAHVELSSGADFFWMRGHLFVDDHPYYTLSDADGKFVLPRVPAGTYHVVCWLPNWNVAWRERNAESALIARIGFCSPLEKEASVTLAEGGTAQANFVVSAAEFERR